MGDGSRTVLLVRRAPTDHPSDEVMLAAVPERRVRFLDWDWQTPEGPRARRVVVRRPGAGREPIGVTIPRRRFVTELFRARDDLVVVRDVGVLVALASLGRLIHRHRRVLCLVEHHPRHSGPAVDVWWKRPFRHVFTLGVNAFVANTAEAAEWLRTSLGVDDRRITEGWWLAGFPPALGQGAARRSEGNDDRALRLVFVGALTERKRPDVVVETVAHLRASGSEVRAWIVGDGPLEGRVRALVDHHGLADVVTVTGRLPREVVAELVAGVDLVLAPSVEDLTCRSVVEAIGLGVPVVVSSAVGTVGSLVEHDRNGIVLPTLAPAAWAAAIAALEPDDLRRLRQGAVSTSSVVATASCAAVVARALVRSGA